MYGVGHRLLTLRMIMDSERSDSGVRESWEACALSKPLRNLETGAEATGSAK